jgi:hypothetical protein
MEGHPMEGMTFGAPGTITRLVDLWVEERRLPDYMRLVPKSDGDGSGSPRRAGRGAAAGLAAVAAGRSGMTLAEGLVLAAAAILVAVVFVEAPKGTITPRVGVLLLTLAMLASIAALLYMVAW